MKLHFYAPDRRLLLARTDGLNASIILMSGQGKQQASDLPSSITSEELNEHDVLTGRDSLAMSHSGNKLYRSLVNMHRFTYQSASKRYTKSDVIHKIISTVKESGGRFLTLNAASSAGAGGQTIWTEMDFTDIYQKVSHALRAGKGHRRQSLTKSRSPRSETWTSEPSSSASSTFKQGSALSSAASGPLRGDGIERGPTTAVKATKLVPPRMVDATTVAASAPSPMAPSVELEAQGLLMPSYDVPQEIWPTAQLGRRLVHDMFRQPVAGAASLGLSSASAEAPFDAFGMSFAPSSTLPCVPALHRRSCPEFAPWSRASGVGSNVGVSARARHGTAIEDILIPSGCQDLFSLEDSPLLQGRSRSAPASVLRLYSTQNFDQDRSAYGEDDTAEADELAESEMDCDEEDTDFGETDTESASRCNAVCDTLGMLAMRSQVRITKSADEEENDDTGAHCHQDEDCASTSSGASHRSFYTLGGKKAELN
jgi:hypothetical protein